MVGKKILAATSVFPGCSISRVVSGFRPRRPPRFLPVPTNVPGFARAGLVRTMSKLSGSAILEARKLSGKSAFLQLLRPVLVPRAADMMNEVQLRSTWIVGMHPPEKYSVVAMVLHWLMVLLIFMLFGLGWYMTEFPKGNPDRTRLVELHVSVGLTMALLVMARVIWRLRHTPPALPETIERWKRRLAEAMHHLLYLLMFVQPVSGYVSSSLSGLSTRFWGIPLPDWGRKSTALHELFTSIHGFSSWVLLALIVLHILGALHHAPSPEKSVLGRMLPSRK